MTSEKNGYLLWLDGRLVSDLVKLPDTWKYIQGCKTQNDELFNSSLSFKTKHGSP